MNKPRYLKTKIAVTVLYLVLLAVLHCLGAECIFQRFLGIACPGCGMTRAMLAALSLDFKSAFFYHTMFWSMPILYLYFIFDGKVFGKIIDTIALSIIAAGFSVNWICNLL